MDCFNTLDKMENYMQILKLQVGDVVELRKPHPCGSKLFKIIRVGSDVRIVCTGCGRDMTIERVKLEKAVKKIVSQNQDIKREGF